MKRVDSIDGRTGTPLSSSSAMLSGMEVLLRCNDDLNPTKRIKMLFLTIFYSKGNRAALKIANLGGKMCFYWLWRQMTNI